MCFGPRGTATHTDNTRGVDYPETTARQYAQKLTAVWNEKEMVGRRDRYRTSISELNFKRLERCGVPHLPQSSQAHTNTQRAATLSPTLAGSFSPWRFV